MCLSFILLYNNISRTLWRVPLNFQVHMERKGREVERAFVAQQWIGLKASSLCSHETSIRMGIAYNTYPYTSFADGSRRDNDGWCECKQVRSTYARSHSTKRPNTHSVAHYHPFRTKISFRRHQQRQQQQKIRARHASCTMCHITTEHGISFNLFSVFIIVLAVKIFLVCIFLCFAIFLCGVRCALSIIIIIIIRHHFVSNQAMKFIKL